jgi:hypothetical protein
MMAKEDKQAVVEGKPVTVDDLLKIITALGESQRSQFMDAASAIAKGIAHPEPTDAQKAARQAALAQRIEQAKVNEANKEQRRLYCVPPATPDAPHRRPNNEVGNFRGMSMIAWKLTTLSERTPTGSKESGPVFFGTCQWCQTEWGPDSPDYAQALSWGHPTEHGTFAMNKTSGMWMGG